MIFCHILDDFHLQGILASMKQKKYWTSHPDYKPKYENDYIVALLMHSMSWSFMIMLPLAIYLHFNVGSVFISAFMVNVLVHAVVDDLKANVGLINLVVDQICHMVQLAVTAIFVLTLGG